jgi:hypothetical protein
VVTTTNLNQAPTRWKLTTRCAGNLSQVQVTNTLQYQTSVLRISEHRTSRPRSATSPIFNTFSVWKRVPLTPEAPAHASASRGPPAAVAQPSKKQRRAALECHPCFSFRSTLHRFQIRPQQLPLLNHGCFVCCALLQIWQVPSRSSIHRNLQNSNRGITCRVPKAAQHRQGTHIRRNGSSSICVCVTHLSHVFNSSLIAFSGTSPSRTFTCSSSPTRAATSSRTLKPCALWLVLSRSFAQNLLIPE